jgi:hypothetical protein
MRLLSAALASREVLQDASNLCDLSISTFYPTFGTWSFNVSDYSLMITYQEIYNPPKSLTTTQVKWRSPNSVRLSGVAGGDVA